MPSDLDTELLKPLSVLSGSFVSMAFWCAILLSWMLCAVIVLEPKFAQWDELNRQHAENGAQERQLSSEIGELKTIEFALKYDPEFAQRVAAEELQPGETVAQSALTVNLPSIPVATSNVTVAQEWFAAWLKRCPSQTDVRFRVTWAAAILCLFSFTCLHEEFFQTGLGNMLAGFCRRLRARYRG